MRIALLHYSSPPIVGGVESVLAHHARLLANDGHEVTILAGRGENYDQRIPAVSYTHLRAHETVLDLVCRLLLENKKHDSTTCTNTRIANRIINTTSTRYSLYR